MAYQFIEAETKKSKPSSIGDIIFLMIFFFLHWGEKNREKIEKNVFFSNVIFFLGAKNSYFYEIKILENKPFVGIDYWEKKICENLEKFVKKIEYV